MKNKKLKRVFLLIFPSIFIFGSGTVAQWNGTVGYSHTSTFKGDTSFSNQVGQYTSEWDKYSEYRVNATFTNGMGDVTGSHLVKNSEKGSSPLGHGVFDVQQIRNNESASGSGKFEISVEITQALEDDLPVYKYTISFFTPDCPGRKEYFYSSSFAESGGQQPVHTMGEIIVPGSEVSIPQQRTTNPDHLTGNFQVRELSPNGAALITTYSWNLTKGKTEDELIVTPYGENEDYDNWMPEPGLNESSKGNVIKIGLHLQANNGGVASVKARSFELRLVNTSRQPGICLNAPLVPSANRPDLRFLPQANATLQQEEQIIKIPCEDGESGEVVIGSFDGGGWTILKAVAILTNGKKIEGVLEQDKSRKDIPIPKNFSGGKIAERWLKENNNPGETQDKEPSPGNINNGDGLSAYEEYRGVMSEEHFKRLDPTIKELGVKFKKTDVALFSDGIQKLENVTGFKVILFFESEIPASRRINQNGSHAQTYKQFALNLVTGTLPGNLSGKAFGSPGIPANVNPVMIDLNNIHQTYQDRVADAARMHTPLTYTEKELLAVSVAHELAHGIGAMHHGPGPEEPLILNHRFESNSNPAGRVFLYDGTEQSLPYTVNGQTGLPGNQQSGDVDCIMALNFLCDWVAHETPALTTLYEVPVIPLGNHLCISKLGTGVNAGGKYFGDATNGKCIEQLKLK